MPRINGHSCNTTMPRFVNPVRRCGWWSIGLTLQLATAVLGQNGDTKSAQLTPGDQENKQGDKVSPGNKANEPRKTPPPVPPARVAELFEFLGKHHPEIRPLLRSLQKNKKAQFQNAMRTLDREVRQLDLLKQRNPARHERTLEMWVTRSKTKLIAAQLAVKRSEKQQQAMKRQLESLLNRHYDLQAHQLNEDISWLRGRLEKLESQRKDLKQQRDQDIQKEVERLTRAAERIQQNQNRPSGGNKGGDNGKSGGRPMP